MRSDLLVFVHGQAASSHCFVKMMLACAIATAPLTYIYKQWFMIIWPSEANNNVDVNLGENEFDIRGLHEHDDEYGCEPW